LTQTPYKLTALQIYPERDLLGAFFERGGLTAQVRQNFTGEMERTRYQDRIRLRARKDQCIANS
jgi:hypothetical protein